jgi:hypothetical protein
VRARPTELKKLRELLSQEHDSVEDLAKQVWELIDKMRYDHEKWVVVTRSEAMPLPLIWGVYDTKLTAEKDIGRNIIGYTNGTTAQVFRLVAPDKAEQMRLDLS